ncbi:MAG: MG2 domain-containing protein [Elusimicrobia bacterium]|nr:MG2 domain-containing protein [Elusimicrobiota bacterium]
MKILLLLLSMSSFSFAGLPGRGPVDLQKADELFEKSLYQEALGLYDKAAGLPGETGLKAMYRAAECEGLLFRYGEAAQRFSALKLPNDPLWRGRFLLLRAELGREFLRQYGGDLPADIQQGTTDVTRLTGDEWRKRIEADYDGLWDLRSALAGSGIHTEAYFIDIKKAALEYTPTLWDFAVLQWGDYLLDESEDHGKTLPDAMKFVSETYKGDYSPSAQAAEKAGAIYEDAAGISAKGREFAAEQWKIKRLLLPFSHGDKVSVRDMQKLKDLAVFILKRWSDAMSMPFSRASAAYEAANLLNEKQDYKGAVDLCKKAENLAPRSKPGIECAKLRAQIEVPQLDISAKFVPPGGKKILTANARNLPVIYFRAYKTDPAELLTFGRYAERAWGRVRSLQSEAVEHFIARRADISWETKIAYPARYQYLNREIESPEFKKGIYVIVASGDSGFEVGSSLIKAVTVNITDIFLLGTSGIKGDPEDFVYDPARPQSGENTDVFHLYAVNALSGMPVQDGVIDAFYTRRYGNWERTTLATGADGYAAMGFPLRVTYPSEESFSIDPLLSFDESYAYWNGGQGAGLNVPEPVNIFIETDRPIYRPAQEVKFKVTALLREPRGFRAYDGQSKLKVTARDQNWQEVFNKTIPFTGLGSAAGSFTIPQGRLLGRYTITAELQEYNHNFSGSRSFRTEEYKRPEFEVKLEDAESAFKYGQNAKVEGTVKYYFGSPVPNAQVTYRVTRSRYIPWYAWWWGWFYGESGSVETASGETRTDDSGKFSINFTPSPESETYGDYPSSFQVAVEARDAGGRTITDSRSYNAGSKAYIFDISPAAGFFTSDKPAVFKARLMNLNDAQVPGSGSYSVFKIEKTPEFAGGDGMWGSFGRNPSLEQEFAQAPDGKLAASGSIEFTKKARSTVKLKALPEGVYRLRLKTKDPWGGECESWIILISADPGDKSPGLKLPPVALFEHSSYQPGEKARILIGASALKGVKYTETLAGNFLLDKKMIPSGGLSVVEIKVGPEHRGGFGLRWFGAGDFKVYSAMAEAEVPMRDRELSLSLDYDKTLLPGQKAEWALKAKDSFGKPVGGEGTVRIFDRSLEYYQKDAGFWSDGLYEKRRSDSDGRGSLFTPYPIALPITTGLIRRMFDAFSKAYEEERLAAFRINSSRIYASRGRFGRMKGMLDMGEADGEIMPSPAAASMSGGAGLAARGNAAPQMAEMKMRKSDKAEAAPAYPREELAPVQVRKDFSETAYFNPQLKVLKGTGKFSFTIPERLTSWKVSSYMITKDIKRGKAEALTVTKKDLMVRLDIPRFFREGDRSVLTAVINNETDAELSGEVALSVTKEGDSAESSFALTELSKPFTVKAHGTTPVYWDIAAPLGTGAYKVRAIARSGALSDAQENDLPVLPSRERLIATLVAMLDGKVSKELKLSELAEADDSRIMESMHLEVQPQLILTVLNSLPSLVHYPYECTEQLLNRYVPLAITNSFYNRYPELKAAVAKIPKRTTITPAWERDNPVRMMTLMETPWEEASKGMKSYWPTIDMLDPKVVAGEKEDAITKLKAYQNFDGSFPWFPGGRPDLYMTLYALEGLAEAARYNVAIPEDVAKRALNYVFAEIPRHMKAEEGETSFILYAAYVVTSFPEKWPEHKTALSYAKLWVDFADKHANALTPFGKAYAAYVYHRLGEHVKAESYLARAMDGSRADAIAGLYWTPEKISWLWYNDSVEKHAFILRTLLALKPKDPRIGGMVQWLLFSRKTSEWKSTKASAAAIYSLLDVMKSKGAFDKEESFKINWADTQDSVTLQPFDWAGKPLRWSKYGKDITARDVSATIEKTGPGLAFASLTGIYTTNKLAAESPSGMMNISRKYYLRAKEGDNYILRPLTSGCTVAVGDQIEVQLGVTTRSQFEYVHIKDPRGAGFEAEELLSGWKWDQLSRYEEPRDSLTNFFVSWLPHGEYILKYRVRPTTPGTYRIGSAVMQSMYAPEFAAHSDGFMLSVK